MAPTNDRELIRDFERRIRNLERPTLIRVGSWTLTETDSGALHAVNTSTGAAGVITISPEVATSE